MVALKTGVGKTVLEFIIAVSLLAAMALWISAMFTKGWFLASFQFNNRTSETFHLKMSVMDLMYCSDRFCFTNLPVDDLFNFDKTFPSISERLFMSIASVALSGLCCILMMISTSCSSKKQLFELLVIILSVIAVVFEVILVIRMAIFVSKMSQNFDTVFKLYKTVGNSMDLDINYKLPYSILIAGIGCLVGTIGCILRIVYLIINRKKDVPQSGFSELQENCAMPQ